MDFGILSTLVCLLGSLLDGTDSFALNPPPKANINTSKAPS
jgi:hypothetical protein